MLEIEAESRPTSSNLNPLHLCKLHPEEVTAMVTQLACDRCKQNTQDSQGHLMIFYLLLQTASSSCFTFFGLPAFLPPLSDSKKNR